MDIQRTFVVADDAYGQTIKELSQIIGRPYMVTFKAFEKLEPHQVAQVLEDSLKWNTNGFKSRSMAVWTYRKKLLTPK